MTRRPDPITGILAAACFLACVALASALGGPVDNPPGGEGTGAARKFEQLYAPDERQAIRRVPPPFDPGRLPFLREHGVTEQRPDHLAAGMIVRWKAGKPSLWGRKSSSAPWYTVGDLVGHFAGVRAWELEGDRAFWDLPLPGDFVVRAGAKPQEYLQAVERIATEVAGRRVTLTYREVQRPVVVLRGKWHYTPVPDRAVDPGPPTLELYADRLTRPSSRGDKAEATPRDLAAAVSDCVATQVLIECDDAPARLQVRPNDLTATATERQRDALLKHLEEQTGLKATRQDRTVRRLMAASE